MPLGRVSALAEFLVVYGERRAVYSKYTALVRSLGPNNTFYALGRPLYGAAYAAGWR